MKFALVDGNKAEATKGAKGICPLCKSDLIAKCGAVVVHHWAHKGQRKCDPWWENETDWHRLWKNNYPKEWQEFTLYDEITGEKHIADVRTSHELVIEFQQSYIDPKERTTRENFYNHMVWVVDGTRLERDYPRFLKATGGFKETEKQGYYSVYYPDECFPKSWLGSSVPVVFDFLGTDSINATNDLKNNLYCLLPQKYKREAIVVFLSRESFISGTINSEWFRRKPEPHNQSEKLPAEHTIVSRHREPTHYYDPRKERFVRKRRL
jgi:hypothetical protein